MGGTAAAAAAGSGGGGETMSSIFVFAQAGGTGLPLVLVWSGLVRACGAS